ncbi:hypothetical protein V6N13_108187 [Hibiscus sabdariffa]
MANDPDDIFGVVTLPVTNAGNDPPSGLDSIYTSSSPRPRVDSEDGQKTMELRSKITVLKRADETWCDDPGERELAALQFYDNLFHRSDDIGYLFEVRGKFPTIANEKLNALANPILDAEIKSAVFYMRSLKSPGVNSLHALFYQRNWAIVRESICNFCLKGF